MSKQEEQYDSTEEGFERDYPPLDSNMQRDRRAAGGNRSGSKIPKATRSTRGAPGDSDQRGPMPLPSRPVPSGTFEGVPMLGGRATQGQGDSGYSYLGTDKGQYGGGFYQSGEQNQGGSRPDPARTLFGIGGEVSVDDMDDVNHGGEKADWAKLCRQLEGMNEAGLSKVWHMTNVRGRDEKRQKIKQVVPYTFTDPLTKTKKTVRIYYGNEAVSALEDGFTPGRYSTAVAAVIAPGMMTKSIPPTSAVLGVGEVIASWGDICESSKTVLVGETKVMWTDNQNRLDVLMGSSPYKDSWEAVGAQSPFFSLNEDDKKERQDLMFSTLIFPRAFLGNVSAVPLGLEWVNGCVEYGYMLNLVGDMRSRVRAMGKAGVTNDERAKAKTNFAHSYLRRSGQRGGIINPAVLRVIATLMREAFLSGMNMGSEHGAEATQIFKEMMATLKTRYAITGADIDL